MLLKRLELQGYKTFASRTDFEFKAGLTAIVGPNGSGKSNIADAIRWVLGEQSYRLLRGKKTEDMIFSGSQKRARAGMAQATIVLDNDDGQLPVEFSEVAITRRAYRSGENEYLINGSRVRLRDVNDLLGASGLGQRTYNVIGQGLVDAALSLRAGERRALFEEAAGISLYKDRREEALQKLEATQRNLERVEDILHEIEPRMRRLERQAARSREFTQVSADLENLLYLWYGYHWEVSKRELRAARSEAETHNQTLATALAEQSELETRLTSLRHEGNQLRARLGDLHRENSDFHRQAEKLQRNLAVHTERLRLLAKQQQETETELGPLLRQREQAATQLDQTKQALAEADTLWQEQETAVREARTALQQRRRQVGRLRDADQKAQQTLIRLESKLNNLLNRRKELARDQAKLAVERETAEETLAEQETEQASARTELGRVQNRLKEIDDSLTGIDNQKKTLRRQRQELEKTLKELRARRREARSRVAELEAQRRALADLRASGAGHDAAVQALLASPDRPQGIIAPVAQLLEVPVEWEKAVAAVLGQVLSALVVSDWDTVQAVLDRTKDGRLHLLPLDQLRPAPPLSPPSGAATAGVAAALVTCEPLYRPVVELLLGQVVLVRETEAGRQLAPRLPAGALVATAEGLIIRQDGQVIRPGRETGSGLLAQERTWRALPAQLDTAGEALQQSEDAVGQLEGRLAELDAQVEQLDVQTGQLQKERRGANSEREAAALKLDRLTQNIAWHRERILEIETRAGSQERELNTLIENLRQSAERQAALKDERKEIRTQLAELPIKELAADLSARERALAQTEGARKNQQALTDTQRRALQQIETQLNSRRQRVEAIGREREQLESQLAEERAGERVLTDQIAAVTARIKPLDDRLKETESRLNELRASEETQRKLVRKAEQASNHAQLLLDRRENALEHLRSRITDDLGLVHLPLDEDIHGQSPLPLGEMVGELPVVRTLPSDLEEGIQSRKQQLKRMGAINPNAPAEFAELAERHVFLSEQIADLREADAKLREVIGELDEVMERQFKSTFDTVAAEFRTAFKRLFGGGSARLLLTNPDDPIESGVEIIARPPGRRQQGLALLSGGERSLTAAALIFSLLTVSPTPFCVLDEVDAMLDEANVGRFRDMLGELSEHTQFVVITHNRGTIQVADTIYGVTMRTDGASQIISLRLDGDRLAQPDGTTALELKA